MSLLCFFFKQKTAYEMRISDWSSDVCSSDLFISEYFKGQRRDAIAIIGKLQIFEHHIGKSPVRRGPRSALRRCHKLVGILIRIARKQTEHPQFGLEIPRHTAKQVAVGPDAPHSQYRPAGNCHRKTDRITIACDRRSPLAAAALDRKSTRLNSSH